MPVAIRAARLAAVIFVAACSSPSEPELQPPELDGITRIVLRAWEDTRAGLPPLAVEREDSVAVVVDFINARRNGWEDAPAELPGNPLFAELHRGTPVVARFGFISLQHNGPGYFITDDGGRARLRAASAQDIATFLAFFGISVEVTPYP